jgi:hypothetical protein
MAPRCTTSLAGGRRTTLAVLWRQRHQRGTIAATMVQSVLSILREMAPSTR